MKSFNDWMDDRGISPEKAAGLFGKSAGTIRNWRSGGVPENLRDWVIKRMEELNKTTPAPVVLPERISLELTAEEFDTWNRAALAEGKILREWIIDALDRAAEDEGEGRK
jgi:hypothetical protein